MSYPADRELIYIDDENFDRFIDVPRGASEVVTADQHGRDYRYIDSGKRTERGLRLFRFFTMTEALETK